MTHPGQEGQAHGPVIQGMTVPPHGSAPQGRAYDPFAPGGAAPQGAVQQWTPAPGAYGPPPVIVLPAQKSVGVAFVLTFFFGVLGMFYATVPGALILLGITLAAIVLATIVIGVLSVLTLGYGAVLFGLVPLLGVAAWITSIIWGCLAASRHNERLRMQFAQSGHRPPGY